MVPTTDAETAAFVLDALGDTGIEFAVLHGEQMVAEGIAQSDLDVVVGTDPAAVLSLLKPMLASAGLLPIMIWNYDIGRTITVFLVSPDLMRGVQLDLMDDVDGVGKYGLRTKPVLKARQMGRRWPVMNPLHELVYLLRKRQVKQDRARINDLMAEARRVPNGTLLSEVLIVFSPRVGRSVLKLIASEAPPKGIKYPRCYWMRTARRLASRIRRPIGIWVELAGEPSPEVLRLLALRLEGIFPRCAVTRRPDGLVRQLVWSLVVILPIRWRAGVVVSVGTGWPAGDVSVDVHEDLDRLCERIVAAMADRPTR